MVVFVLKGPPTTEIYTLSLHDALPIVRVCDASIMPAVPCANTNFPTIMVGENVSVAILAE